MDKKESGEVTFLLNHLKTFILETREEDFWHLKEVLVSESQTGEGRLVKADLQKQTLKSDLEKQLNILYERIRNCKKCALSKTRINVVFARGSAETGIMFIGEAPGYDEDRQGLPFVGRAGQLLNEVLESVGLPREKVYITNVVKCHPLLDPETPERRGNDRPPTKEEIATCLPILREQIEIFKPKIICTLGAVATNTLLGATAPLSQLHGKLYSYGGVKLLPTFHPAAIFRTPTLKSIFVADLRKISKFG